jgi:hypothetical protein
MSNLPDLDTLTAEDLEKLANEAREEMSALGELWLAITETTLQERLAVAAVALANCKGQSLISVSGHYSSADHSNFSKAIQSLKKIKSSEERISLAIAILEGVMTDDDDDGEIEEALGQKDLNKAFRLAVESEAIKEFYAGASLY